MSDFRFVARGRPYSSDEIAGAVNRVVRQVGEVDGPENRLTPGQVAG